MTEVNVAPKIDPAIDTAFEKLKPLDAADQEIGCKHIGEKYGRDVEAKVRQRLAIHAQQMKARIVIAGPSPAPAAKHDILDCA